MGETSRCEVRGFKPTPRFTAAMASMRFNDLQPVVKAARKAQTCAPRSTVVRAGGKAGSALPYLGGSEEVGVFKPLGFWDPFGLAAEATDGQLAYFREAELKHGRICMLSTLGTLIGEKYHPLWGGDIDVNAVKTATLVSPTTFWPLIIAVLGFIEVKTSSGRATEFANSEVGFES